MLTHTPTLPLKKIKIMGKTQTKFRKLQNNQHFTFVYTKVAAAAPCWRGPCKNEQFTNCQIKLLFNWNLNILLYNYFVFDGFSIEYLKHFIILEKDFASSSAGFLVNKRKEIILNLLCDLVIKVSLILQPLLQKLLMLENTTKRWWFKMTNHDTLKNFPAVIK